MIGQADDDDEPADDCLAMRLLRRFERLRKNGFFDGAERALDELKLLAAPPLERPDRTEAAEMSDE